MDYLLIALPIAFIVALFFVTKAYLKKRGLRAVDVEVLPGPPRLPELEAPTSSPPGGVYRHGPDPTRDASGLCRFCERPSRAVMPRLELVRAPLADWLARHFNVVPVNQWKIEIGGLLHVVCQHHHDLARAKLDRRVAEMQVEYADYVEKQRVAVYEYVRYGLFEVMSGEAVAIKKPRKAKPEKAPLQLMRKTNAND